MDQVYLDVDNPLLKGRYQELLNGDNTKLFVVEDIYNNELIAYSVTQIIHKGDIPVHVPSKLVYIDNFCVKSNRQKTGIGKLLFNHVIDYAKSEGASSVQLGVSEFNKNAIKFYEALGMSTRSRKMELSL